MDQSRKSRTLDGEVRALPSGTSTAERPLRLRGSFVVNNPKGLHTRPCTELVRCASQFEANIQLRHQRTAVNAKSLLGILTLAAGKGSQITVEAEGGDALEALEAILRLAENRFFISY